MLHENGLKDGDQWATGSGGPSICTPNEMVIMGINHHSSILATTKLHKAGRGRGNHVPSSFVDGQRWPLEICAQWDGPHEKA